MTERRNIAASVRQRLLNASRTRREDFQVTLTRYALERLLYRLSKSAHRDQFIIKGAMLFSAWNEVPHRPTRDLDLLSFGASDISRLEGVFREIVNTEVEPDGIEFFAESVRGGRIKEDQEYEGVRLSIQARLEQARLSLQIDVGFGDAVTPAPEDIEYPTLLADSPAPRLRAYSRYSVVAEKFQAMVVLGIANTRMKDFFDVWTLARSFDFDGGVLCQAMKTTFERRGTEIPSTAPLALTPEFYEDRTKQSQWDAFLKRSQLAAQSTTLDEVAAVLRDFLLPPASAVVERKSFDARWTPTTGWQMISAK
ncbi:MAG: nucleotidyl transferase AbiEii/AbiGii toxin family protein [Acidobacteria bacterium]|nr:nucleotidyl transferase AbiEii/AbiGii toxin family protein [Acidobacteriota bacterium]